MRSLFQRRPTPAMGVALLALFVALSGTAVALPGKNRVDSNDPKRGSIGTRAIANNSVRSSDIRRSNVFSSDIRNESILGEDVKDETLTGNDVTESSLGKVPSATSADSATNADALGGQPPAAYARVAQPGFTTVTLNAGYSNFGGGFATAAFLKDTLGFVHLRGLMNCPASGTAYTLPVGFRPAANLFTPLAAGATGAGNATIGANGTVSTFRPGGGGPCGLDGISFKAEQ